MSIFNRDSKAKIAERIEALKNFEIPTTVKKSTPGVGQNWFNYEGARPTRSQRWRYPIAEDHRKSLDSLTWRNLMAFGRQIFQNVGPVRGGILEKATFSVGHAWLPLFQGKDRGWGDRATLQLLQWYRNCDVRGDNYDFRTNLIVDSILADRDGDVGCVKTQVSKTDRYPQIQQIEAHRIFGRSVSNFVDDGSQYNGNKIYNGVVLNQSGRPIAYHVLGDNPEDDQYISANDMGLFYHPEWATQGRGVSALAHCILNVESYQDIQRYLRDQVALDSSLGLNIYNATGSADPVASYLLGINQTALNPVNAQPGDSNVGTLAQGASEGGIDVQMESIEGGTIRYFKAGSGEKIETVNPNRPSANATAFMETLLRDSFAGLEWSYEFTRNGKEIGGANIRLITEKIVRSVQKRQHVLHRKAYYAVTYALARFVELGILPAPKNPDDLFAWSFSLPPEANVDSGREAQQKRNDVLMGLRTRQEDYSERGLDWLRSREQLGAEAIDLLTRGQAIADQFGVALEFAVNLIEQRSTNPPQFAQPTTEQPTPSVDEAEPNKEPDQK